MTTVICPYCEQGEVWQVNVGDSNIDIYCMCFECDTIWQPGENVKYGNGINFELLMERKGEKPDWSKIRKIRPLE